ncbi:MAG TPA: DUF4595 domain-containing protein [Mucilaginibacter sp.]|jgi:hypothetical protein|nr:DUF4595 domain-containing protein [Mucilaginibacter sp.]
MSKPFYCLLFLVLFISCSKESKKPISTVIGCQIATIDHINNGAAILHESCLYDNQGRVSKININDNIGDSTYYIYEYQPGKISQTKKPNSRIFGNSFVFYLDSQNRITKSVESTAPGFSHNQTYTYDTNGYLSEVIEIDSNKDAKNIDSALFSYGTNGNLNQIVHRQAAIYPPGNSISLSHYSTSFTQTNDPVTYLIGYESTLESYEDISFHQVISKYLGKGPVNSIAAYTQTYNGNETINYSYTKDAKGNILSMTETGPGRTDTYNFTYNCQ